MAPVVKKMLFILKDLGSNTYVLRYYHLMYTSIFKKYIFFFANWV